MKYVVAVGTAALVMFGVTALALATYLSVEAILALLIAGALFSMMLFIVILLR